MKLVQLVSTLTAAALTASSISATPLPADTLDYPLGIQRSIQARDAERFFVRDNAAPTSPLTNYQQYSFPAQLAQTAYCGLAVGIKVGDATLLWTAGDGRSTPMVYVAYSPSKGVIVSHQGTNTSSFASILNDADFDKDPVNSRLSYLGASVEVHGGFQDTWLRTADSVLAQVKSALASHPGSAVLTVGHSLGAAVSLLDALYLKKQLPSNSVRSIVFGQPRTGNQAFADAVDANLAGFVHINNGHDPVPRLPPTINGYVHSSGEIWINPHNTNTAVTCPGQENENCIDSVSPFDYKTADHTGTYFNVHIAGRGENCPPVIN
ncbi:related to triacylglycerol lipase precursor [Sporisorium reilianum f. sp. reilianum]|uniref:Related to triacylglycerol lipase n=1 Tax=Sporisorium reilianum f. sp. reilianum TaxID=72559 RepID=A0A2N8UBV0_9BASI|nr:related to triacylglycerol lipase precursor [Sporisorium reilianum f. sp. reilianum]